MFVNFNELKPTSRVWIFQSNREFSDNEVNEMETKLTNFVNTWKRHGKNLQASYLIKYNHFIVLAVDESINEISGCSIDASVNLIKGFEASFGIDLTNKLNISFKINDNINIVSLKQFKEFIADNKINEDTIVFNNLVTTIDEFSSNWETQVKNSWHQKFLPIKSI